MTPSSLPLARFPLIHTHSFEEALSIQASINESPMRAEPLDRRTPFVWKANGFALGAINIAVGEYGAGFRGHVENLLSRYSLSIPLEGAGHAGQHVQSAPLVPGRQAALGSTSMPAEISIGSGYRGIQVVVADEVLEGALDTLTGTSRNTPLRFELPVNLEQDGAAGVMRLLEFVLAEADQNDSVLSAPAVQARLSEAFVYSLLLGLPHNHSQLLKAPVPIAPRHLRRAEEYIAANAHRTVTMADLATVADVSARTLFAAFRAHRGCSPMSFLRERRLELARTRLLASPASSITEIALACGFEHHGRFSIAYRKRFGESPSQTLAQARSKARR